MFYDTKSSFDTDFLVDGTTHARDIDHNLIFKFHILQIYSTFACFEFNVTYLAFVSILVQVALLY